MALIAFLPQAQLIYERGRDWHGTNAAMHADEVAYSAYVASLIRGRPRRNDPYTGVRETPGSPQPESLFSIQMVPPYLAAAPARLLGLSASTVFVVITVLCAVASTLAIFWLVLLITGDGRISAASVCIVLGLGTLFAGQGLVRYVPTRAFLFPQWVGNMMNPPALFHLPFLRIYQPAVAFPLFFGFGALLWFAISQANKRRALIAGVFAGATFSLLVFSYFFLWTAAAAFLICILGLWFFAGKNQRARTIQLGAVIAAFAIPTLVTYFWFLSHRAATVDSAQALVRTRTPDLFRLPELIAFISLAVLAVGLKKKVFEGRDARVVFAASLALTVVAVFNQQIITGRSLQPFHYEWFIGNYCAGLALVLTLVMLDSVRKWLTPRRLAIVASLALLWGATEVWLASSLNRTGNLHLDEARLVTNRLNDLSRTDGTREAEAAGRSVPIVLVADLALADRLPTDAPQAILWSPHLLVFPSVTEQENRERFFQQLHYLGFDENRVYKEMDKSAWAIYSGFFSYERLSPMITGGDVRILPEELRTKVREYTKYSESFGKELATRFPLSYVVVKSNEEPDFKNLDRWYQRDTEERIGKFVLYRVKLRE